LGGPAGSAQSTQNYFIVLLGTHVDPRQYIVEEERCWQAEVVS